MIMVPSEAPIARPVRFGQSGSAYSTLRSVYQLCTPTEPLGVQELAARSDVDGEWTSRHT
jgi:hypothetical protein